MTPSRRAAETANKRAERLRRKEAGEVRIETWCSLEQVYVLDKNPLGRAHAIKALIEKEVLRHEKDQALSQPQSLSKG